MKVTPPLAVTPLAQEDDMRWNPNDDGMAFNPSERCAPDHNGKHALATSRKNQFYLKYD